MGNLGNSAESSNASSNSLVQAIAFLGEEIDRAYPDLAGGFLGEFKLGFIVNG